MGPNQQDHRQHLFTSSPLSRTQDLAPRTQDPVDLLDADLRRAHEQQQERNQTNRWQVEQAQQQQLVYDHQQQQGPGEGADIQIVNVVVNVVPGTNEEQEVRNWKLFAGNVR